MEKLVSVSIPIIKTEFLKKSIKSCLLQSYSNYELIILNNAKEKETRTNIREIVNSFDDNRIKYHENEEQIPMISNWNKCVNLSKGEYLSILCDDDLWHKDFLTDLITLAKKYPDVNVLHCKTAIVNPEDEILKVTEESPEHQTVLNFIYSRISDFNNFFLSDFLLKTQPLKDIGGFISLPSGWGSDDVTYYNLSKETGVAFSKKLHFYYRDSPLSVTNNNKLKEKLKAIDIQIKHIFNITNNYNISLKEDEILIKMIHNKLKRFELLRKTNLIKVQLIKKYGINKNIAFFIGYLIFKFKYANL